MGALLVPAIHCHSFFMYFLFIFFLLFLFSVTLYYNYTQTLSLIVTVLLVQLLCVILRAPWWRLSVKKYKDYLLTYLLTIN